MSIGRARGDSDRRAGDEEVLRRQLLELIEAAGRKGVGRGRLAAWGARRGIDEKAMEDHLAELSKRGVAIDWNRRRLAVRHTDWTVGTVRAQARGGALLLSGQGGEAGYFIPANNLNGSRDGDLVLVKPVGGRRGRRSSARRRRLLPEASVVRVLARGTDEIVGFVDQKRELIPFDSRVRVSALLPESAEPLEGHFVAARLDPAVRSGAVKVPVTRLDDLGEPGEPGTDVRVMLRHFQIPDGFSRATLEQAAALPPEPRPEDLEDRRDCRGEPTITIDGATARDFDDAISVTRSAEDYLLRVHIADVAHYVEEGSALDLEAYERGTSVYFPDRAIPMLPEVLSNGLCSLRPNLDRLVLSADLRFSAEGELIERSFGESVIRSHRRFTYDEVRDILEGKGGAGSDLEPVLLDLLRTAEALMRLLLARRIARGSIDFDLPEGDVILDTDGVTIGVKPGERNVAHRMIEEFMIAANEAVAAELVGAERPALYRIHTEPDRARFEELRSFLEPLGISLELGPEELHPSHLQEVLRQVEGHDEEPFVATLVLRAMKRALYDPECHGHYALASRAYTHFTSPIRRYPDLVVHRALKRWLSDSPVAVDEDAALRERLPALAEHTGSTERRAERAERALLQWKVLQLLAPREGEVFSGRVTGVQPFGVFLVLEDYHVDGLLPIASLTDDYYSYEPEKHRLVGRKGGVIRLADRMDVRLESADPIRRLLTLAPVG
ncbi:MAG: ribonuclease R [Thermoanaerobaculia bacterium]